ncbi:OmpH family outer membrane protein [Mucilaginibacter conchicola]|uniref:OmpH family outer membrane protein n=1 Tax=Mucilaginibacter conchicola TaxID=2303333 RepID=A0A372NPD1_9SPHI|nr:OmpH family outer membrane protein [Mucilaginibacter conchicola]RFZ90500.1 OmpH family outer membrane protein [Mucilaginibacter conchicola]
MKKLLKVALVAAGMLFAGNFAQAQSKIGHINFQQLIDLMPETKTVKTQLEAYQKQFIDQLTTMNNEYQTKGQAYTSKRASMTDAQKTAAENELQDIAKRLQDYQQSSQQQVEAKQRELGKPLIDKARGAVEAAAKEKGYGYVLDTTNDYLVVSPAADDLLPAVKTKLGLK